MRKFIGFILFLLFTGAPAFAEESGIKVTEIVITSKIVKGKPIDSIKRLSSATDKNLYCFIRTRAPEGSDAKLRHIWYNGDAKAGEFELAVKGGNWRTYSKKLIQKGWA
ncbi:MAG: DUF2914 domain-containing protein, partial [Geobacter sp.]|nr:DUF2914 domain-containing protein [Geobacter sp.]